MQKDNYYPKYFILSGIIILLSYALTFTPPVAAQTPPPADMRLLAWSPDGTFLLGATSGPVVTMPDNSQRLAQVLWRLAPDGTPQQQLAQAFGPQLDPANGFLLFSRLDAQNQPSRWGIDLATGMLQPIPASALATPDVAMAGDPAGALYPSPNGRQRAILVNRFFEAELWVGQANQPAQLILSSSGQLFSDLAWHPAGTAVALIKTPLGSQVDSAAELWRVDLPTGSATRLSQNNAVDRSPVWSGDGRRLAVIRNERVMTVPADRLLVQQFAVDPPPPAARLAAQAQLVPPATIRVIHHASNTCRNVPVGQIDTIAFEDYVKRVVPHEVFPSWPAETLKAQAVAARTYGWDKYLQDPGGAYHVTDWVNHQYMCDTTVASTNQAVDETWGEYLAHNGQIITAMFSAENASPTLTNNNVAYLQAVDDPVSFGQTRNGHGYGMGQWGAQRWAGWHNWSYQAILRHYYANVTVEQPGGSESDPPSVSLAVPWSGYYLTGPRLRLLANTSDDSGSITQTNIYLSTPLTTTLLISQSGPTSGSGYGVALPPLVDQTVAGTLVLTAETYDASGKRGVSPPVTIGLDRVNPTGLLTTATTLSGTTVITDSPVLSLSLSATDATAGATSMALGQKRWEWEGETFTRQEIGGQPVGQPISDTDALNGSALRATVAGDSAGSWRSAEFTLPAPQKYRAYFRLKASGNDSPQELARLELLDSATGTVIGLHRLYGPNFRAANSYQEFHVDFDYQTAGPVLLRLTFKDVADITLDRAIIVEYPVAFSGQPTYSSHHFRLKVIDGAGNVSNDLLVLPLYSVSLPLIVK